MTVDGNRSDQRAADTHSTDTHRSGRRKRPRLGALKPEGVSFGGGYEPVATHMPHNQSIEGSKKHAKGVDPSSERLVARSAPEDATRPHQTGNRPEGLKAFSRKSIAASGLTPKQSTVQNEVENDNPDETRFVWLRAVPRLDQLAELKDLDKRGFAMKDILKLAGKRASAAFQPAEDFVAMPDVERLSLAYAFKTSKRVSANLLEGLHDQADRLRVRSDDAMLRGQFEPLFWREIDRVVDDLKDYASA